MKKHGIGKGLMTVWRATNRDGGDFPTGLDFGDNEVASVSLTSTSMSRKKPLRRKITRQQVPLTVSDLLFSVFSLSIRYF